MVNSWRCLCMFDDVLLTGTSIDLISAVKEYLHKQFHIKDLGTLRYFLGLEVGRLDDGIFLNQRKYALDLLDEHNLLNCKPVATHMDQKHSLSLSHAPLMTDALSYRRLIGKLIYLTVTRPDLAYAVHILSQFMGSPTDDHWRAAIIVLRYVKQAPAQGIFFAAKSDMKLNAYCDADWAACPLTRRSITGYCVTLGTSVLSWKVRKQFVVSRSSAESEYRSMDAVCSELVWLHRLLHDMAL